MTLSLSTITKSRGLYLKISQHWLPWLSHHLSPMHCMFNSMRKNKLPGRGYELLALKQAQLVPRHEVAIDLIGPYKMEKCMGLHLIEITITIDTAISTTIYAAQAAIHNTMNISPESLIPYFDDAWVTELEHLSISFLRDMFLNIPSLQICIYYGKIKKLAVTNSSC